MFIVLLQDKSQVTGDNMKIVLTCVRHGEATHNVKVGYSLRLTPDGSAADTSLTDRGRHQAEVVGERLAEEQYDMAVTSDLERARNTALAILKHHPELKLQTWMCVREPRGDTWKIIQSQIQDSFMPRLSELAQESDQSELRMLVVSHSKFLMDLHHHLASISRNKESFPVHTGMVNTAVGQYELVFNKTGGESVLENVVCYKYNCGKHLQSFDIL